MLNIGTDHLGGIKSLPVTGMLNIGTDHLGGISQHLSCLISSRAHCATHHLHSMTGLHRQLPN
jgi:hypothetical protein